MKTFKNHKAFQSYNHPQKDKVLKYLEAMYSVGSDLNKIDNLQDRKNTAASKAGLKLDDMTTIFEEKDEAFKNLRHIFLSEFQFNNKYTNLTTFQQMLWNIQKDAIIIEGKDLLNVERSVDLMEKLEKVVTRLFGEIYGSKELIDVAMENIKGSQSVEERLKNK
jgi:hypothetical protein